jgi:hypothetical protein
MRTGVGRYQGSENAIVRVVIVATIMAIAAIIFFETRPNTNERGYITCNNCAYDVNERPSYTDKLIDPVSIFTLCLVISTILLWRSTQRLADVAADQSRDMQNSIAEASRAAAAMEKVAEGIAQTVETNKTVLDTQRDFWRRQMRAYVSVEIGASVRQNRRNKTRFEFRPVLHNNGQTPAKDVRVVSICSVEAPMIPADFDYATSMATGGMTCAVTIFPHQNKFHSSVFLRDVTLSEMRELLKGTKVFHLWGRVSYKDVFDEPKYTHFSFVIFVPTNKRGLPIWHSTEQHNDAT